MDPADDTARLERIRKAKEHLVFKPTSIIGPVYHEWNKRLADLYLMGNEELKGIYHLTEAHAATLRQQTFIRYDYKEDLIKNSSKISNKMPVAQGLNKIYVEFDSEIALQEEKGLLSRLRDMPKEWTVVQLTRQYDYESRFSIRKKEDVSQPSCLHIVRLPCGSALDEKSPLTVLIGPPRHTEGMPTIFELMHKATKEHLRTKKTRPKDIRDARDMAAQMIKDVVNELSSGYLKEWRCLLLGSLYSSQYWGQVKDCIDQVVSNEKHKSYQLDSRSRQLLWSVAEGAVHLTTEEIKSAVVSIVSCKNLAIDLIKAIEKFKDDLSVLMVARRHPVILIVDELLDLFPWEMMPILKKHPVSRVPSIHFLHGLYHEHKDHIVDGCRLITNADVGFYIVNPDQDLKQMESRLVGFLDKRIPDWKGIKGTSPTEDEFCDALTKSNVFLYCGHFNGTHFLSPDDISRLRVVSLPLLFGCSSIALQDLGGRALPSGVPDKYMIAGSACVLGMLWTVTSDDTDCMTVMLLNSWLPGEPVDLTSFRSAGDMLSVNKEPELLRLMRYTREVAVLYSNGAAFIARGIPVKMVED